MRNLEIEDGAGDTVTFAVSGSELVAVRTRIDIGSAVLLDEQQAQEIVDWLRERYGLQQELETLAANHLRIVVPPATGEGAPREVVWTGDDEPPAWFAGLAELALTGRLQHRATLDIMREVRDRSTEVRPDAGAFAAMRRAMGALGCERAEDLPDRIEALRSECDTITDALLQWAGVSRSPDGVDQLALIEKIKDGHAKRVAEVEAAARRQKERSERERWEYDRAQQAQLQLAKEAAAAQEREPRARVQAELDRVREERDTFERNARAALDQAAALEDERNELQAKLVLARRALRSVQSSSAPGSADMLNVIKRTLEETDPGA